MKLFKYFDVPLKPDCSFLRTLGSVTNYRVMHASLQMFEALKIYFDTKNRNRAINNHTQNWTKWLCKRTYDATDSTTMPTASETIDRLWNICTKLLLPCLFKFFYCFVGTAHRSAISLSYKVSTLSDSWSFTFQVYPLQSKFAKYFLPRC